MWTEVHISKKCREDVWQTEEPAHAQASLSTENGANLPEQIFHSRGAGDLLNGETLDAFPKIRDKANASDHVIPAQLLSRWKN